MLENIRFIWEDLVLFVQIKKRDKHPWRSVTFSKVAVLVYNFTKSNTPPWVFVKFTNGTKSRKA